MTDVLYLLGFIVTVIWFFTSRYTPRTMAGLGAFVIFTLIVTPVISIPVQWAYAKYVR